MVGEVSPDDRLLRIGEVATKVALSKTTIYRRIAVGTFPAGVSVGGWSHGVLSRWRKSEVNDWIASLPGRITNASRRR
jgi:prophage regulatory protein